MSHWLEEATPAIDPHRMVMWRCPKGWCERRFRFTPWTLVASSLYLPQTIEFSHLLDNWIRARLGAPSCNFLTFSRQNGRDSSVATHEKGPRIDPKSLPWRTALLRQRKQADDSSVVSHHLFFRLEIFVGWTTLTMIQFSRSTIPQHPGANGLSRCHCLTLSPDLTASTSSTVSTAQMSRLPFPNGSRRRERSYMRYTEDPQALKKFTTSFTEHLKLGKMRN